MEIDGWFCTTTSAISAVNGVQKDKKHDPARKDLKALLLDTVYLAGIIFFSEIKGTGDYQKWSTRLV